MRLPKQILVPTDLGPSSDAALDYAIGLAKPIGATIKLMHVFEPPGLDLPDVIAGLADTADHVLRGASRALDETIASHHDDGVAIDPVLREGRPWRVVVDEANALGDVMIVMATHGRMGLDRWLLGSVAEKVVRMAACPVVVVPAAA